AYTTDPRISRDAARTTSSGGCGAERFAFLRSRRHTFSTSTMASSTTSPTAIARPPSVMPLMEAPIATSTPMAVIRDNGIAVRLMTASRLDPRNATSTMSTRMDPIGIANSQPGVAVNVQTGGPHVGETDAGHRLTRAHGVDHIAHQCLALSHPQRIRPDLDAFDVAAMRHHLCDPRNRHQPGPKRPVGERAQLARGSCGVMVRRGETDLQDRADRRKNGRELWLLHAFRQV